MNTWNASHNQSSNALMPSRRSDSSETMKSIARRSILERIEEKVQSRKLKMTSSSLRDSVPVHGIARALDRCLFQIAPNFEEYADETTLDDRINRVVIKWLRRRRRHCRRGKTIRPYSIHFSKNDKMLQKSLALSSSDNKTTVEATNNVTTNGRLLEDFQRYKQAKELVQEIRLLQLARVQNGCHSNACSGGSCSSSNLPEATAFLPGQQPMPCPVRNMFFHTGLVSIMERNNNNNNQAQAVNGDPKFSTTTTLEQLIQQARQHVQEYKQWCLDQQSLAATATATTTTTACAMNRVPSSESVSSC